MSIINTERWEFNWIQFLGWVLWDKKGQRRGSGNHESSVLHEDIKALLAKMCTQSWNLALGKIEDLHTLVWSAFLNFTFYFWL